MNKQRVLIKHHAQLADPAAVQQYYYASALAADHLLQQVIGKPLQHVVIADAITTPELKYYVSDAIAAIEGQRYFDAMIATRKALFRAVESEYDIRMWAEHDPAHLLPRPIFSGLKAPYYTRNRAWIQQNVAQPTDYVQLDHDRIRAEMLEIGIDPEEFFNVWRLTPAVYYHADHGWAVKIEPGQTVATEDDARYCLDVVVSIIRNQESRKSIVRARLYRRSRARILHDQVLLARATQEAPTETTLHQGDEYDAGACVTEMDGNGEYVHIFRFGPPPAYLDGYIPREACDLEEY